MRAKWLAFLLSRLFDRTRSRREDVIAETQPSSRAALWRGARHSSRYLKPFLEDAIVLHLAAKTSASTTSAANSMLAISENVACNGCAWKWRPRSVRVRMASLPAEENGILNTSSRPCDTNSLFKLDSKSTNNCNNNRAFQAAVADRSSRACLTDTLLRLRP